MLKSSLLHLLLIAAGLIPALAQSPNLSNVSYGTDPAQVLDLYLPNDNQTHPLIVLIHGGAWVTGDKGELAPAAQYLVTKGFAVANINYRLATATTNQYPTAVNDAGGAVAFLRANAASFGYNGSNISALGTSAGAYLALELGISNQVNVVVDFYGPTNLSDTTFLNNMYLGQLNSTIVATFLGATLLDDPSLYTKASPIDNVSATTAPTIIFHGSIDNVVPVAESQVLNKTLHGLGVTTQLYVEQGLGHGFLTSTGYNPDPVLTQAVSFINANLLSSLYFQNGVSLGILGVNPGFLPTDWQGVGATTTGWQQRAIADVNGDGVPDIVFQNGTNLAVMLMNANGTAASWMTIGSTQSGWQLRGATDIAGNGQLDLIFQNGTVLNYTSIATTGKQVTSGTIGTMGTGWELRAVADLNNDGRGDLIFQNGNLLGALQVGTNFLPTAWNGIGTMTPGWVLADAVAIDVNGNGQPNLIFQNGTSLGALQINTSFLPVVWHGIGTMGAGWTLPGNY